MVFCKKNKTAPSYWWQGLTKSVEITHLFTTFLQKNYLSLSEWVQLLIIVHQVIIVNHYYCLLCHVNVFMRKYCKWYCLVFLTVRVDSRFRSKPRVFISTLLSESDSRQNKWSVPRHRTISPLIFWSAWNAMFLTHKHQKVLFCNSLRI